MAAPIYKGTAQAATAGSWLSGLGSWFSGPAPVYQGNGQGPRGTTGYLGGADPAYKPAPTDGDALDASATTEVCREPERITVLIPRELIDPQQ